MKKYFQRTLATLMVCAIAATTFAEKVRKEHVTLTSDVVVNGTLVKAGEYDIRFDEKAGELSILKNGKVKAKTSAHLQARDDKAKSTALKTRENGKMSELIAVTFGGSSQDVIVTSGGGAVTGSQIH